MAGYVEHTNVVTKNYTRGKEERGEPVLRVKKTFHSSFIKAFTLCNLIKHVEYLTFARGGFSYVNNHENLQLSVKLTAM